MKQFNKTFALAIFLFITVHCSLFTDNCEAQWIQTNGPYGGDIRSFAVSGTNLFAGTTSGGVFCRPTTAQAGLR
ncbi:MAG: hypothetical protein IPG99_10285 [Ignavibacteria bacterium]|nr:hypothetical protein [Ignavibacteria bacterium]